MRITKATFVRYADLMVVFSGVLNVIKFALNRDVAALKTLVALASVSFTLFALYLTYFAN